jgi:hydroxymethylpyrimidine pyrophosphatase-like HAD family hydrolase
LESDRSGVPFDEVVDDLDGPVNLRSTLGADPAKVLLIAAPEQARQIVSSIAKVPGIVSFTSYPEYVEVMPSGVDKGTALRLLYSEGLLDASTTVAIGDGAGDIPMFDASSVGIAVSGSRLDDGRWVTLPGPAEFGVTLLLVELLGRRGASCR